MLTINTISLSQLRSSGITTEELLRYLPESGRARLLQITNVDNRDRSLLGELLARYSICRFAGIDNPTISFQYAEKGKPHLTGHPGIHFNISHSGDRVACACSGSDVGIDIEHFRKVNFRVAERFFSPSELKDLLKLEITDREEYFFTLWTIKESFLKAIGSGLTRNLNSFTVTRNAEGYSLLGDELAESFSIATYQLDNRYHLAVCSREPVFPAGVNLLLPSEMIHGLLPFG